MINNPHHSQKYTHHSPIMQTAPWNEFTMRKQYNEMKAENDRLRQTVLELTRGAGSSGSPPNSAQSAPASNNHRAPHTSNARIVESAKPTNNGMKKVSANVDSTTSLQERQQRRTKLSMLYSAPKSPQSRPSSSRGGRRQVAMVQAQQPNPSNYNGASPTRNLGLISRSIFNDVETSDLTHQLRNEMYQLSPQKHTSNPKSELLRQLAENGERLATLLNGGEVPPPVQNNTAKVPQLNATLLDSQESIKGPIRDRAVDPPIARQPSLGSSQRGSTHNKGDVFGRLAQQPIGKVKDRFTYEPRPNREKVFDVGAAVDTPQPLMGTINTVATHRLDPQEAFERANAHLLQPPPSPATIYRRLPYYAKHDPYFATSAQASATLKGLKNASHRTVGGGDLASSGKQPTGVTSQTVEPQWQVSTYQPASHQYGEIVVGGKGTGVTPVQYLDDLRWASRDTTLQTLGSETQPPPMGQQRLQMDYLPAQSRYTQEVPPAPLQVDSIDTMMRGYPMPPLPPPSASPMVSPTKGGSSPLRSMRQVPHSSGQQPPYLSAALLTPNNRRPPSNGDGYRPMTGNSVLSSADSTGKFRDLVSWANDL